MIVLGLILLFLGMAVCSTAFLSFGISIFRTLGMELPLHGPLGLVPTDNFIMLGWGQLAVACGLLLGSLRAFIADSKNPVDGPSN